METLKTLFTYHSSLSFLFMLWTKQSCLTLSYSKHNNRSGHLKPGEKSGKIRKKKIIDFMIIFSLNIYILLTRIRLKYQMLSS